MKIAVFMTGWNSEYLQYLYKGLETAQKDFKDEISAYTCFAQLGSGESFDKSEFDFFQLADLSAYDGILFASITIKDNDVKRKLTDWIKASGKPCVTLEEVLSGMSSVGIDQRAGMQALVDHLVQVHGIRSFGFLDGLADTFESDTRRGAVVERVESYGLRMLREWIVPGSYVIEDGMAYGEHLLEAFKEGREIPEAVMCANDLMAAGILDTIKGTPLYGKIAVTGFDRYSDGEMYSPSITTLARPREKVAYEGIRLLRQIVQQRQAEPVHRHLDYRIYVGNTCGCDKTDGFDNGAFRNRMFHKIYKERLVATNLDSMEEWVASKASLEEIMEAVGRFLEKINARSGQFFLSKDLFSQEQITYQNCNRMTFDWHAQGFQQEESGVKIVMPLHYQQRRMGYCILSGVGLLFQAGMLDSFFRSICYAMENCIQQQQYRDVNDQLQRLYRTDQLTGIYNRFGMEDIGQKFYHKNCEEHRNTVFIFCDINRLKQINDTYGHEAGDWVIQITGKALAQLESEYCIPFRFGGDEFIVITTENSGVDAEVIRRSLAEMCTDQNLEDGVEISIGVVVAKWDDPENMMSFLKKADKAMYEEKKLFHENCGTKENDK